MSLSLAQEFVEKLEILVVMRKENAIFANGIAKMNGVVGTGDSQVGRQQYIMPRLA